MNCLVVKQASAALLLGACSSGAATSSEGGKPFAA